MKSRVKAAKFLIFTSCLIDDRFDTAYIEMIKPIKVTQFFYNENQEKITSGFYTSVEECNGLLSIPFLVDASINIIFQTVLIYIDILEHNIDVIS